MRYRPLALADQEAHAAQIALLTRDIGNVDPDRLAMAGDRWVQTERFMPKASDLLALLRRSSPGVDVQRRYDLAAQGNAYLASLGRFDVEWFVTKQGELKIGHRLGS